MPGAGTLGVSLPFADARYLRLSGANQASWAPTSTVVPNLNASLLEGHNAAYFSLSGHTHAHSAITGLDYASAGHTGFEPTVTKGNLTESTSSVLTIGSGTGVVIGSGTTLQVKQSSAAQSGYLSSGDWTTFNAKQAALSFPLASNLGGTGVANNASSTLTISGDYATTLTVTNTTALTLPTSGYLVQSASGTYAALDNYLNQDLTTDSTVAKFQTLTLGAVGVVNPMPAVGIPFYSGRDGGTTYFGGGTFSATATDATQVFAARGRGTHANPTAVLQNDWLGIFIYGGQYDTTVGHLTAGAYILSIATKNWSSGDTAAEIQFLTSPKSSSNPAKRWTIQDGGTLLANGAMAISTTGALGAGAITSGVNGAGGVAGSIIMLDGNNPGTSYTLDYTELGYVNGLNQVVSTTGTPQFARLGLGLASHAVDILSLTQAANDASAYGINLTHTGTGAGSAGLNITKSGVVVGESIGGSITVTGGGTTNTALKLSASGATNNYGLIVTGLTGLGGQTAPICPLDIPGSTTNSSGKFGSIEIQAYALNNTWIAENAYYNGGHKYRANGYAVNMSLIAGGVQFYTAPSGTAAGAITYTTSWRVHNSGGFVVGSLHATDPGASNMIVSGQLGVGVKADSPNLVDILQASSSSHSVGLNVLHSGAIPAGVAEGATISVTGLNVTNIALILSSTNATNNWAILTTAGSAGFGNPTYSALHQVNILQTSTTTLSTAINALHSGAITGSGYGGRVAKTGICSVESIGWDVTSTGASLLNTGIKVTVSGGTKNNAFEAIGAGIGIVLASPDGTRYLATMANGGTWNIAAA